MVGEPELFETRIGNVEQSGPEDFGQGGEGSRPGSKFRVLGHIRARQVVEDLFLDPLVQRHDIRDVTRDGVNRASDRDVQGKGPRLHVGSIGISLHRQGIPASQQGLGRFRMVLRCLVVRWIEFGPQVFTLAQPYRFDVPGLGALAEFPPEYQGQIFSGGHEPFKVGHIEVEMFMVELFEHVRHDFFKVVQIDNHARDGIDPPAKGHFKEIIVPMLLRTRAKDLFIARLVPLGFEIPVGSGKFYPFREGRSCHTR